MKMFCLKLRAKKRSFDLRMSPPLLVTEDTPPDMLVGHMDLRLVLPNGTRVRMSVDRRTPMMDLLVQVTTAYKISPAGHVLQPYGESGLLPYKPSTPIGLLDTWTVHIVPKNQALQNPASKISLKQVHQPFEQTYRFQINLPKNQLYVTRVTGKTTMRELLHQTCSEKGLDPNKYTLRHPKQLDRNLYEELSVMEYGQYQVSMVSNKILPSAVSSEDILAMSAYSSESSSRSLSPDSSVSPRAPVQPSRPLRKRRPAPKPPTPSVQQIPSTLASQSNETDNQKETSNGPVNCHSRTSSDSSGYHEASVLSESPDSNNSSLPDSLPRRTKQTVNSESKPSNKLSRSLSNLHHDSTAPTSSMKPAQSTSCLVPSRKKKPAPAPPVLATTEEEKDEAAGPTRSSRTLPPNARLIDETPIEPKIAPARQPPIPSSRLSPAHSLAPSVDPQGLKIEEEPLKVNGTVTLNDVETKRVEDEIERMFDEATREHVSLESGVDVTETSTAISSPEASGLPSPDLIPDSLEDQPLSKLPDTPIKVEEDDPFNWEYKLPAPPTFRDVVDREGSSSPSLTEYSTMTVGNMKDVLYAPSVVPPKPSPEDRPEPPKIIGVTERKAVVRELSAVLEEPKRGLVTPKPPPALQPITSINGSSLKDNFTITTYTSNANKQSEKVAESQQVKYETKVTRRSSFTDREAGPNNDSLERRPHLSGGVKRSLSHVSPLSKARLSASNLDLLATIDEPRQQETRETPYFQPANPLRKTTSELSINVDLSSEGQFEKKEKEPLQNGFHSINVLKSIFPHLSQSQGALNVIDTAKEQMVVVKKVERGPPRPNITLTTWGERPKRQISIKSDRDYVFGNVKPPMDEQSPVNGTLPMSPVKPSSPEKKIVPSKLEIAKTPSFKGPKTFAYKTLETGNTKPLKQILDLDPLKRIQKQPSAEPLKISVRPVGNPSEHAPIVRSVELKKPYKMETDGRMIKDPVRPPMLPVEIEIKKTTPKIEILKTSPKIEIQKTTPKIEIQKTSPKIEIQKTSPKIEIQNTSPKIVGNSKEDASRVLIGAPRPVSCYLFGYEPKIASVKPPNPPPPPKKFTSIVDLSESTTLKSSQNRQTKSRQRVVDPREELLASIRSFGKNSLRKVSAR